MNNDAVTTQKDVKFETLIERNNSLESQVDTLSTEITTLKKQVEWFKNQFKLANLRHFGKSSENTAGLNLGLFDEALPAVSQEDTDSAEQDAACTPAKRKKKSAGRLFDISKFPIETKTYDLANDKKICGCGEVLKPAGEDRSTQVDHIPETFKVIEHVTLNYCCRSCNLITSAKKPLTALPKCMATSGFIAEVMIRKYEQHLPLYRQSKIFERVGAIIPDNTLGNWVMRGADELEPLNDALIRIGTPIPSKMHTP
jgi:transposase